MATTKEILSNARQTLATARLGLDDAGGEPERRLAGLHNAIVFGRSVTFVLQNPRSTEADFDAWYAPIEAEMHQDALMRFFNDLRSKILKQGVMPTAGYAYVRDFNPSRDMAKFGPPPKGARSFFIGDSVGGTGWEVETAEGVTEKFYVQIPSEIGKAGVAFVGAPGAAANALPSEADALRLTEEYLVRVERILALAEDRSCPFGHIGASSFRAHR